MVDACTVLDREPWHHSRLPSSLDTPHIRRLHSTKGVFGDHRGGQLQWSIMWWAGHHRAHHWYLDTDKDPYDVRRGFFFAHVGWLIGYNPRHWGRVDISDLQKDSVVIWQQRYYLLIAALSCFGIPTAIAHYGWNDWKGGLIYAGFLRLFLYQQVTYLTNSLAHSHWAGDQPYSNKHTAVNNFLLGIVNCEEGYHNFHHTFPTDYRNGVQWYDIDLSKWVIWLWSQLGLTYDLVRVSKFEIERARRRQTQRAQGRQIERPEDHHNLSQLPTMRWSQFISQANTGRCLVSMEGVVYDITDFMCDHPGGRDLLLGVLGNDCTALFHNGPHAHSPQASSVLVTLRVAVLEYGPAVKDRKY